MLRVEIGVETLPSVHSSLASHLEVTEKRTLGSGVESLWGTGARREAEWAGQGTYRAGKCEEWVYTTICICVSTWTCG